LHARGLFKRVLRERRGLIKVMVDLDGHCIDVVGTHLDAFVAEEREAQAAHLRHRLVDPGRTTVVLGDMNALPGVSQGDDPARGERTHSILASSGLADARILAASRHGQDTLAEWATYPATRPAKGLDWVLASRDLLPEEVKAIGALQSDHRGLFVRYTLLDGEAGRVRVDARSGCRPLAPAPACGGPVEGRPHVCASGAVAP
jgi:endonuclease/exonuclease/phosphatase family metal-dependent hydrolase